MAPDKHYIANISTITDSKKPSAETNSAATTRKASSYKFLCVAVTAFLLLAVLGGVLLTVSLTTPARDWLHAANVKKCTLRYKGQGMEEKQDIQINLVDGWEAIHTLGIDERTEAFILHDFKARKTVVRFADENKCLLRDMALSMDESTLREAEKISESADKIDYVTQTNQEYFRVGKRSENQGNLSSAISEFCGDYEVRTLEKVPGDGVDSLVAHRQRRMAEGCFTQSACKRKETCSIRTEKYCKRTVPLNQIVGNRRRNGGRPGGRGQGRRQGGGRVLGGGRRQGQGQGRGRGRGAGRQDRGIGRKVLVPVYRRPYVVRGKRQAVELPCALYDFHDVKDCITVEECEEICT
ncbi:uncharacterized protein LOC106176932 isoform X2 [Lingula anatina]|uniref:Uncharacterized protein LOC106176932 isoform X2 n=1 Tax=Lingula anatina TaxID=7574 RepID=A0A2R2MNH4_LINAN|nr:uncharacterized protein LOC106176932 isoform X2 [Lingula anatina]|eukprot:XP_023931766.1 uncharacterized protein LOC106176932 isoform X2 [Lingula anatina]